MILDKNNKTNLVVFIAVSIDSTANKAAISGGCQRNLNASATQIANHLAAHRFRALELLVSIEIASRVAGDGGQHVVVKIGADRDRDDAHVSA